MTNGGRKKTQAPHKPSVYEELVPSVHLIGLEPTRRKTPDPKSGASTNFATGALFRFGHPPILCSVLRPIVSFYVQFQMCRHEIIGCKDS